MSDKNTISKHEIPPKRADQEKLREALIETIEARRPYWKAPGYDPDNGYRKPLLRRIGDSASEIRETVSIILSVVSILRQIKKKGNVMEDNRSWGVVLATILTAIGIEVSPEMLSHNIELLIQGGAMVIGAGTALWRVISNRRKKAEVEE